MCVTYNPYLAFQILLNPINGRRPMFFLKRLVENGFTFESGHLRDAFDGCG